MNSDILSTCVYCTVLKAYFIYFRIELNTNTGKQLNDKNGQKRVMRQAGTNSD